LGSAGSPHGIRRTVISPCRRGYRAAIVTLPPVSGLRRWLPALAPMARRVTPPWRGAPGAPWRGGARAAVIWCVPPGVVSGLACGARTGQILRRKNQGNRL
jgi:hypothetical protein